MSEKDENKARKLRKRNKSELKLLFEQNTCIDCGGTIENEPKSVFKLAPAPEMLVIKCDKCEYGNYKVIRNVLDELNVKYDREIVY